MKLREETQHSLEAKCGVAQSTVSKILKGTVTPTVETLTKLFDVLGVPFEEICEPDVMPNPDFSPKLGVQVSCGKRRDFHNRV